jgi:hypothetical protein
LDAIISTMNEVDWSALRGQHERLRWARIRWQMSQNISPDAGAAAASLGINPHTYRAYERAPGASKHISLDHHKAAQFGRKFKAHWQWLLTGEGHPDEPNLSPAQLRVVQAMNALPPERESEIVEIIERLLRIGNA